MIKEIKSRINKPVFLISAVAGGILWFFCNYLYSTYRLKIAGFLMFPALCTFLFTVLFLIIWISSVVTGSFDKKNHLYTSIWGMLKYFSLSIVIIFFLSMLLEYLYELNPNQKITEPTSYIFVIDESASMSSNDPNGLRYNAISEIMNSPENTLPYMVYAFSSESRILRDMGYLTSNEEEIPINCDGATSIRETTLRILQDYKDKKWSGGKNPKIIFLTDGFATDLDNGFLWFKGNVPEFNTALEEYSKLGISISTVGLGSVDKQLMRKMAETTGGTFISINQAEDLADAMNTAATSYSERNLLSIRYMKHLNMLFGCLRVLFLSLIGLTIGGLLAFAYMDNASIPLILISSAISSVLGSILFELGIQTGVYQSILWFLLWILYASTLGYSYPENSILGSSHMRISSKRIQTSGYHIKKRQELRNVNIKL